METSGPLLLVLRILLVASLYSFLGWAMLTLWRDLRDEGYKISAPAIPSISLTRLPNGASPLEGDEASMLTLQQPEVIVGRSERAGFPLVDETVSARHARLSYHHNQWWVEDLKSTNGTFLNDQRVTVPTVIVSGDELRCGQVSVLIAIEEGR